jgi:GT2 family glycosyltransferase
VVAVVVTRDPGPWFEETLTGLATQDYPELSVLVLVSGGQEDPTARVARVLPGAFVRRLDEDRGFGVAANEALTMVEGAAFLLLCHDDCAPAPDAVHVLVEESYRSNAGIVGPKQMRWEDPEVLLHVGMNVDKTGAVVERVQPGEVDHGQQDGVRDVFVVPGGLTLVRTDLFAELGGYDPILGAMGEDLDLCWRAQIAGARVVVATDAVVRHLEATAVGLRRLPPAVEGVDAPTLQDLERRHELWAVLKCYSVWHLLRVLPQVALLALGEMVVAMVGRDRARVRAVAGAWRWCLRRLGLLRGRRRAVKADRRVPDHDVRRLQLRGSARLSTFFSRLSHQGLEVAQGRGAVAVAAQSVVDEPVLTGSVGLAFSEDADFDELDDLGHRSGRDRFGRVRRRPVLSTSSARLTTWLVVAAVLLIGSRNLLASAFPLVGQLTPFLSWTATWHHLVSGWQPAGVGTTAPATSAFALLGAVGTVFLGGMGLVQKVLVLGCLPLGAFGLVRLLRPLASARARLAGAVAYLALALVYDALAQGRWDGMVAYAVVPFVLVRLARISGLAPYSVAPDGADRWTRVVRPVLALGVIEAVAVALAPAVAPATLVCALGIVAGSVLVGGWRGAVRALAGAVAAIVVALVLLAPWVIGTLAAGHQAVGVFGLTSAPWSAPSFADLVRFAVGPVGASPLSWLLIAAAVLPLLIGRQLRLAWAGRLWMVALMSWVLAWAVGRGWTAPFSPSVTVVLVPAAVAMAACVGLGVAAFEADLSGYRFGWRQLVSAAAVAALVIGMIPVVVDARGGRWGLPGTGYADALSFLSAAPAGSGQATVGGYRVLWLGDPRALPIGGWSVDPGLAYATSENGTPNALDLWAPAGSGPASTLARAVTLAQDGRTVHLGRLLAPSGVRYVVVVESTAPQVPGVQSPPTYPAAPGLIGALSAQQDLAPVGGGPQSGFFVYLNTDALTERAARLSGPVTTGAGAPSATWPTAADLAGWHPVLPGPAGRGAFSGLVPAGTVYAAYAPGGRVSLRVGGRTMRSTPAFGWAAQFPHQPGGSATLWVAGSLLVPLSVVVQIIVWVIVAALLVGRRRWLGRRRRRPDGTGPAHEPDDDPGDEAALEPAVAGAAAPRRRWAPPGADPVPGPGEER